MNKTNALLIPLLKNGVFSAPLAESFPMSLAPEEEKALYRASKAQDLAHIVGASLKKNKISLSKEGEELFQKQVLLAYFRYEKIQSELKRLCETFENAKILFIPLKGSILRAYYPEPWMRTSCDIDLFVHTEDVACAAKSLLEQAGYTEKGQWAGERSFFSPNGIHLELHFYDEEDGIEGTIMREVWDHTQKEAGYEYRLQMEWEYFYLYHIAHMAKHFAHGGCGIRPFMDLCIMEKNFSLDREKLNSYLEAYGLSVFASQSMLLADAWFGKGEFTPLTEEMGQYILGAGIYGSVANQVALEKGGKNQKMKGLRSHIWLPFDVIKHQFPILLKRRWLLPFCQAARWIKLVFKGGVRRSLYRIQTDRSISKQKVESVSRLMEDLNLS